MASTKGWKKVSDANEEILSIKPEKNFKEIKIDWINLECTDPDAVITVMLNDRTVLASETASAFPIRLKRRILSGDEVSIVASSMTDDTIYVKCSVPVEVIR
ncbi:MAG TPA: hypothetical protein ENG74_02675 [Thermoplasmatales archaeon]|nr:hypothetical protein [Thermoplasmatales archaeon]